MGWLKRLPTLQDFNQYTDGLRKTKPVAGVIASKTQRWRTFLFLSFPGNLWVSTISFLGQKEFFRASDCRARRSVQGSTAKKWLPPSAGGSQPDVLPARTWLSLVGLLCRRAPLRFTAIASIFHRSHFKSSLRLCPQLDNPSCFAMLNQRHLLTACTGFALRRMLFSSTVGSSA